MVIHIFNINDCEKTLKLKKKKIIVFMIKYTSLDLYVYYVTM